MIPLRDNMRLGRAPFVTFALVVANVVVYVLATRHGWDLFTGPSEATALRYGAIPSTRQNLASKSPSNPGWLRRQASGSACTVSCCGI